MYEYDSVTSTSWTNAGGRGFDPTEGKNLFFTFYSIRVECEELFCQTNKTLKIIKFDFLSKRLRKQSQLGEFLIALMVATALGIKLN